ncbi:CMD domain-containing protein [Vreelandella profundi]|uniref:CMD domain-containing protein n=1 Tax=Vreelandella profundi TaxID=2852117 RepID=UPI001EF04ABA|nr:hypothetical protein [Halomonas profundi]
MTNVIEAAANVPSTGPLADALAMRSKLMDLTQASYEAALLPSDPGGLTRETRAAFACRMAKICQQEGLRRHYGELLSSYGSEADPLNLATTDSCPPASEPRLAAMVSYVDLVTRSPKDASESDIESLRKADINESDIVRLAGLVAFVNYQLRVAAVLSVMGEAQ